MNRTLECYNEWGSQDPERQMIRVLVAQVNSSFLFVDPCSESLEMILQPIILTGTSKVKGIIVCSRNKKMRWLDELTLKRKRRQEGDFNCERNERAAHKERRNW